MPNLSRTPLPGLLLLLLLAAGPAGAKPAHLQSLASHYGKFLPARLNNCGACHVAAAPDKPPAGLSDFPHNPFGNRLRVLGEELGRAGARSDLAARLRRAAVEDSDGDGIPNQVEILMGSAPGDPREVPSQRALVALPALESRFQAFLKAYRWRPFEPVVRPPLPAVANAAWSRNPIDRFLAAEHERRGLRPQREAEKAILLRRVTLDLTGLSPTPAELHAFLADRSPRAYEKLVDRLLASPRYGERWGRHWMDVWRYSDWTGWGEQVRDSKPHIWRWRDWIVESLNADKGYDRMVVEMLAGDEVAPQDPSTLRATGYLVRNYKLLSREKWLQDTVDHTGQAFLGLTVGCARCHDHMYDPVTQNEYYRLRAFFEPHEVRTDWVPGQLDQKVDGLPRAFDAQPGVPTYLFVRGDDRQPVKDQPLAPGVPASLGGQPLKIEPVPLPLLARVPEKQPHVVAALRADLARRVEEARKELAACDGAAPDDRPATPAPATAAPVGRSPAVETARLKLAAAEAAQAATEAVLQVEALEDSGGKDAPAWKEAATRATTLQREQAVGEARLQRALAAAAMEKAASDPRSKPDALKAVNEKLAAAEAELKKAEEAAAQPPGPVYKPRVTTDYPATSSGRRLALARWITDPANPLAARVAVNHVWLRHFGEGIVPSPENLGRNGRPPSHPALLDWLAAEFMAGGWRMKPLHRLIVTSAAYRMASTPDTANLAIDRDNRYLWRMNSRRLEAEAVRDNLLWAADRLDLTMGGPDIDQNLGLKIPRRTLYFRHAAEKEMEFLQIFDGPNVTECYFRKPSVVPQQALALANSELALAQARLLARDLSGGAEPAFIAAAFERVLSRRPTAAEAAACREFLAAQSARFLLAAVARALGGVTESGPATTSDRKDGSRPAADPALRARENLVLVLFNHNDFVTVR